MKNNFLDPNEHSQWGAQQEGFLMRGWKIVFTKNNNKKVGAGGKRDPRSMILLLYY